VDGELKELMTQKVVVFAMNGRKSDGSPKFSTSGTTYKARVVRESRAVRPLRGGTPIGGTLMLHATAWVNSTVYIDPESKVVLPDGTTPPLFLSALFPDDNGGYACKLQFGWAH
jgi:hypothetical protein